MFDVSKVRIFNPEKVKQVTLDQQARAIAQRIMPHVAQDLRESERVELAVRSVLPRFHANGWTEDRYLDTLCIWAIQYGPDFENAPEFAKVHRFYVCQHETQHDVFAFIIVTLRASENA